MVSIFLQRALALGLIGWTVSSAAAAPPGHRPAASATYAAPVASGPAWAPYAGQYNYAHVAPTFHWGWFGAERFASPPTWHRGYYGEQYRWTRR